MNRYAMINSESSKERSRSTNLLIPVGASAMDRILGPMCCTKVQFDGYDKVCDGSQSIRRQMKWHSSPWERAKHNIQLEPQI